MAYDGLDVFLNKRAAQTHSTSLLSFLGFRRNGGVQWNAHQAGLRPPKQRVDKSFRSEVGVILVVRFTFDC
jgi:hypothetical protein